jgi:hypothetical protein
VFCTSESKRCAAVAWVLTGFPETSAPWGAGDFIGVPFTVRGVSGRGVFRLPCRQLALVCLCEKFYVICLQ